jgi:hypothetical protein
MDTDIWLPLVTLVGGWGLAQRTETLRERRTTNRDRLARRAELQRTTLLELQEELAEIWPGVLSALTVEMLGLSDEEREEDRWRSTVERSRKLAAHRARAKLLASRVDDAQVRELATEAASASSQISTYGPDHRKNTATLRKLEADYSAAVARIGELLRERY